MNKKGLISILLPLIATVLAVVSLFFFFPAFIYLAGLSAILWGVFLIQATLISLFSSLSGIATIIVIVLIIAFLIWRKIKR